MSSFQDCRFCGSTELGSILCEPPSPHYARVFCSACHRTLGFEAAPWTPARARSFVMPFGKHAGKSLEAIHALPGGPRYLAWLADWEDDQGPTRAAAAFLKFKAEGRL